MPQAVVGMANQVAVGMRMAGVAWAVEVRESQVAGRGAGRVNRVGVGKGSQAAGREAGARAAVKMGMAEVGRVNWVEEGMAIQAGRAAVEKERGQAATARVVGGWGCGAGGQGRTVSRQLRANSKAEGAMHRSRKAPQHSTVQHSTAQHRAAACPHLGGGGDGEGGGGIGEGESGGQGGGGEGEGGGGLGLAGGGEGEGGGGLGLHRVGRRAVRMSNRRVKQP